MKLLKGIFQYLFYSILMIIFSVMLIIVGIFDWGMDFFKRKDYE